MMEVEAQSSTFNSPASFLLIAVLVSVIVAISVLIWRRWFETYHLATVDPHKLYRDGNRGLREYRNMLRRVKPRTVVSLIDDAEAFDATKPEFAAEAHFLQTQSQIELVRIPIPLGGWPDASAIEHFLALATDPASQPVVVHCAQGVRRTGMMVAAYQMSVLGWPKEKAKDRLLTFGHSQRTVGDVQRFIDVYDPATRRMRVAFETSEE